MRWRGVVNSKRHSSGEEGGYSRARRQSASTLYGSPLVPRRPPSKTSGFLYATLSKFLGGQAEKILLTVVSASSAESGHSDHKAFVSLSTECSLRDYLVFCRAGFFFFRLIRDPRASSFHASRSFGFLSIRSSSCSPRGFLRLAG
jgi:hypothetical protein